MLFHTMDPARSLADDLDQHSLTPTSVELAIKELLPRSKVQAVVVDRHHHLSVHDVQLGPNCVPFGF
jgi:hypothetical protein